MSDPKPEKRYRASKQEWQEIRKAFSEDRCWVCTERWTELHHILNRSHSGDDLVVNLAPLCGDCHRRVEARDPVARSLIRQALLPSNLAYIRYKFGDTAGGWLDANYSVYLPNEHAKEQVLDLGLDLGVDSNPSFKIEHHKPTLTSGERTNVA